MQKLRLEKQLDEERRLFEREQVRAQRRQQQRTLAIKTKGIRKCTHRSRTETCARVRPMPPTEVCARVHRPFNGSRKQQRCPFYFIRHARRPVRYRPRTRVQPCDNDAIGGGARKRPILLQSQMPLKMQYREFIRGARPRLYLAKYVCYMIECYCICVLM